MTFRYPVGLLLFTFNCRLYYLSDGFVYIIPLYSSVKLSCVDFIPTGPPIFPTQGDSSSLDPDF